MIKLRVKEVATDLIYFYNMDTIKTLDDFSVWFVTVSSLNDLTIRRIQLIDSSTRNSEWGGSTEIDVDVAKNNLANSIREAHADTVSITAFYKGVPIPICVKLDDWTLSIGTNKKHKDALDALENLFATMNLKRDIEKAKSKEKKSDERLEGHDDKTASKRN